MRSRLDLQKSKEKQRLVYKMTTSFFFTWLLDNSRWLLLLALPILVLLNEKNPINTTGLIIIGICMIVFLVSLYLINSLVKIQGSNLADNRKRIIQLIHAKFPDLVINDTGQCVIRCKRNTSPFNWGKQITIIFDDADLLINLTTIGTSEVKSPFHAILNYRKMKNLRKEFFSFSSSDEYLHHVDIHRMTEKCI